MLRGAFGLVSLLVAVAIVAYIWANQTKTVVENGNIAHDQAEVISGRSADGTPVGQSITTVDENEHGGFKDLLVTDVVPGGGYETRYGLKKGDRIISVESLTNIELTSGSAMKDLLADAYQKMQPIVVIRNGRQETLPLPPGSADAAPKEPANPTSSTAVPSQPQSPPPEQTGGQPLPDEINRILQNSPSTH